MKVSEFKNLCSKEREKIKNCVLNLSDDDRIDLRAKLNEKIVNTDNYNFLIFEATFFITWASLYASLMGLLSEEDKQLFLNSVIYNIIIALLIGSAVVFILTVIGCSIRLFKQSQYVKALSFLDDYSKEQRIVDNSHIQSEECIETFEQTEGRHKREIEQLITRWKSKQEFVNKQIELYEATLNEKN